MKYRQAKKIMSRPSGYGGLIMYCRDKQRIVSLPGGRKLRTKAVQCFMHHALRGKKKNRFVMEVPPYPTFERIDVEPILVDRETEDKH